MLFIATFCILRYSIKEDEDCLRDYLYSIVPNIESWYNCFYINNSRPTVCNMIFHIFIQSSIKCVNNSKASVIAGVTRIIGVEETIWSPAMGMRGMTNLLFYDN